MRKTRNVLQIVLIATLGFGLCATKASAVDFATPKSYSVGTNPAAVIIADFNGDGKLDIAVANSGSGNVSILLGNGDGTFKTALNSTVSMSGNGPSAVAAGDFNGDGKPDLIVVNAGSPSNNVAGAVNFLAGNGDGTFQTPVAISGGQFPFSLAVGDLNGDHRLDLVIGDQSAGTLTVLLGNGNGTFQLVKTISLGSSALVNSVVVVDFNGDTKPDVVAGINGGAVISLGNGDGSFQAPRQVTNSGVRIFLLTGDFNGDHKLDVVLRYTVLPPPGCRGFCFSQDVTNLYLGNGDGTFQTGIAIARFFLGGSSNLAAADFNGDGKIDLFLLRAAASLLLLGTGNGSFQSVPPPTPVPTGPAVAAADINGDSMADFVITDAVNNAIIIVLNLSPTSGADLAVTVNPTQTDVVIGNGDLTYTATILNEGPRDSGVTLTEDSPAGWRFVSAQPSQGTCTGTTTIICDLGSMLEPSFATVKFDVTPTTPGTFSDSMTVSGTQPDLNSKNNSASLTVTAVLPANVSVAGSASPASGLVGDKATVSARVSNSGPATATNVVLTDGVTDATAISNVTISQGTCTTASGQITCTIGTLAPGAMVSMSYIVTLTTPGTFDNTLNVAADQPNLTGSTQADVSIAVNPTDLAVAISLSPNPPAPGASITATTTATNNGPSAAVSVAVNVGFLPVVVAIGSVRVSQGACDAPVDGGISCSMGSLAAGASATVTVVVTAPGGGQMTFGAGVSSGQQDPNPANNNATMTVNVVTPPDFVLNPAATSLTMKRGGQVIDVLTFAAQGGFSGMIALACSVSGPAPMPTCGISPNSVAPGDSAMLTVSAPALAAVLSPPPFERAGRLYATWLAMGLMGGVLAAAFDKKRRRMWALCLLLMVATILQEACGGGSSGGPPPQNYTVTVTATSGAIQHSTPILVTVQ